MGFYDETGGHHRGDNFSHSPLTSRYRQPDRRDSMPQSPFKTVKSPLPAYNNRFSDDHFGLEDDDPNALNAHLSRIFDRDDTFTVGQMFGTSEPVYAQRQRDHLAFDAANWVGDPMDNPLFRTNQMQPYTAVAVQMPPSMYEDPGFNSNGCRW